MAAAHWITLTSDEGIETHVMIGRGGLVVAGPRTLIGANIHHLPAAPHRTTHAPGVTPHGARDHPDFHEHVPPAPKPGKPYAREHGALQTRQEQGPAPLTAEETKAGLERARAAVRKPDTAPPEKLPMDAVTLPEGVTLIPVPGQVSEEKGAFDQEKFDTLYRYADSAPRIRHMLSMLHNDLLQHTHVDEMSRATMEQLHQALQVKLAGLDQPWLLPRPEKVPVTSSDAARHFARAHLEALQRLPWEARAHVQSLLTRAARKKRSLYGMRPAALEAMAEKSEEPAPTNPSHTLSYHRSEDFLHNLARYRQEGGLETDPHLPVTWEGAQPDTGDRERQHEQELNALPAHVRHLLKAVGTPVDASMRHDPAANGSLEFYTGAIKYNHGANRHTVRHEAGHAVDRAMGILYGGSDPDPMRQDLEGLAWRSSAPDVVDARLHNLTNVALRPNMRSSALEFFADAFAMHHGPPEVQAHLRQYAPDVAALMDRIDDEVRMTVGQEARTRTKTAAH